MGYIPVRYDNLIDCVNSDMYNKRSETKINRKSWYIEQVKNLLNKNCGIFTHITFVVLALERTIERKTN
jgi:hypothetical protein